MNIIILGTGLMAAQHAKAFLAIDGVEVVGCIDIDETRAKEFAATHGIDQWFTDLEQALGSVNADAIANVTPDAVHYRTTMQAISAGLHVFCEKPLATNYSHAAEMTKAALDANLITGVNLTYRNVSAIQTARELVASGRIGEVRHFEASYLQSWLTQPAWGDWKTDSTWLWRLSQKHGSSGVLGDVGIHIFDFATFAIDDAITQLRADLTVFDKAPGNRIGEYDLDANDSFVMTARTENGATGVVHASRFASGHINDLSLKIFGTKGGISVSNSGDLGSISISEGEDLETGTWRDVSLEPVETNYEKFARAVESGSGMQPDFATATRLQAVIDSAIDSDASGKQILLK
ncbi:MAG: gfo/Idh/MocA family oxidoreductase [Boseongicola sp.]|nr:MAG: gfo/Idh/MocA family oxidoreductase [Boseongicola sp.]